MIKNEDLEKFKGQYPYGSELFGVYQTLLGWRGTRARRWFLKGFATDRAELQATVFKSVRSAVDAQPNQDGVLTRIGRIDVGRPNDSVNLGSTVLASVASRLAGGNHDDPAFWNDAVSDDVLSNALERDVRNEANDMLTRVDVIRERPASFSRTQANPVQARSQQTMQFLERESRIAGQVKLLRDNGAVADLKQLFFGQPSAATHVHDVIEKFGGISPFSPLDPENILSRTIVSPIGVIHLFRQYFFELDSFLGSPVGHVWVAPHTSVELVEINSRRVMTESIIDESAFSRLEQYGESFTLENLHEAVTRANQQDLSFGASVSGSHSWIVGSVQASSSINYHQTQSESRLAVHDMMRRQTQRVSSLMERSLRTSFKTVTTTEDISSKRYVVANPDNDVINYELRRKMRRVAVQLQDVGTYLSWQTFVDDPGRELGVAELVHIAEPPNLANIPHPQMIVPKAPQITSEVVQIPFSPYGHSGCDPAGLDDNTETFRQGVETSDDSSILGIDYEESIQWKFEQKFRAPDKEFQLAAVHPTPLGDAQIRPVDPTEITDAGDGYFHFTLYMEKMHFHESNSMGVKLELDWEARDDLGNIQAENDKRLGTFVAEQKRAFEEAYVKAARERIVAASKTAPRRYEDLRQEERIAVYRRLVQTLAPNATAKTDEELAGSKGFNYPTMSDQTRHAWSEILNRLFDLEKMLYFVAPEWWKPQARQSQAFGAEEAVLDADGNVTRDAHGNIEMQSVNRTAVPRRSTVSWGGGAEAGRANYYITESSAPAKLGSSLGWLLQLDGDSMRNAFLNAPWVKAVVPIRPGREQDAITWLKGVMEGADGLDGTLDAQLKVLAAKVAEKHQKSATVSDIPDLIDPAQTVAATPVDRVFEFGFDPLAGGFRAQSLDGNEFEVVDQWIEVVPTDQIAAVAVKYDPSTGRQIPPA